MLHKHLVVVSVALALGVLLPACSGDELEFPERAVKLPTTEGAVVVSGMVHFEGTPPKRPELGIDSDAWCRGKAAQPTLSDAVVVTDGHLVDTLVWVEKGLEAYTFPLVREPTVMANKGCMYVPHVLAVQQWQPVRFVSQDGTAHNINTAASAQGFNRSLQGNGDEFTIQFREEELSLTARCNIHPWMEGFLHVLPHPYFVVTGTDGRFALPPLPPGTYTLTAVHPKLGKRSTSVTLAAGQQPAPVDFTFGKK